MDDFQDFLYIITPLLMGFIFLVVSWNLGYGQILIIEMFLSILIWLVLRIWVFLGYTIGPNFQVLHSNLQF